MKSLTRTLKQDSPVALAREVIWRTRRKWGRERRLARLQQAGCPVSFRYLPYYSPDLSAVSERSAEQLTAFADDICCGRFHFLGYPSFALGRRPKWNADFVCGLEWPQVPLQNGDCVRFDGSDVKVPYELSRLQALPVLGKAHVLTQDERYREAGKELLSCWIEENPAGIGVNWSLAMEVALRAASICFLLNLLYPFRSSEEQWLSSITRSLWQHLLYIEANIEFSHLVRSNHYLSNILGLYCLSLFLQGEGMAGKRARYRSLIEAEICEQVYEDGGDHEASTGYQVLVVQMFTTAMLLMRADRVPASPRFASRLQKMYRFLGELASPSGQLPHFGDCDDGRVELLIDDLAQMRLLPVPDRNSLRVPGLLNIGRRLFDEGTVSGEDAAWYGLAETPRADPPSPAIPAYPQPSVTVFPDSGVAVAKAAPAEIVFFAAPNGIGGKGSHTHNDKLSIVFRLNGEEVFCDSGTGCYTRDPAIRNRFRMTRAHNTVVIDGAEQNTIETEPLGLFRIGREAQVSRIHEGEQDGQSFLRASHSGYSSLGVIHTRTIWFSHKHRHEALLQDLLDGSGKHSFELRFHLAPGWTASSLIRQDSETFCRITGPRNLQLTFTAPGNLRAECLDSLISMTYGGMTASTALSFSGETELPACLTTRLCWAD